MCSVRDVLSIFVLFLFLSVEDLAAKKRENKMKCPHVKAIRNFDLNEMLGKWYVIQYYASSEEAISYRCMRALFTESSEKPEVSMNFTYIFVDDPDAELLYGNITWDIPDPRKPSHWVHAEDSYEGIYNTYVLDSDYSSWALLLHCAEKSKSPRYLSSFIMSRTTNTTKNVVTYLKEKLPRYDIDLKYMFPMNQSHCTSNTWRPEGFDPRILTNVIRTGKPPGRRRHPMKNVH